jgi:hypothetical protein
MTCPRCGTAGPAIVRTITGITDKRERNCHCGGVWTTTERTDPGTFRLKRTRVETPVEMLLGAGQGPAISRKAPDFQQVDPIRSDLLSGSSPSPDLTPSVLANPERARVVKGRPSSTEYGEDFERLWAETGRHGNKHPAFKLWQAIKNTVDLNMLISTWKEWEQTDGWQRGFVPHLRTWLYRKGWQDPVPPHAVRGTRNGNTRTDGNIDAIGEWYAKGKGG